MPPANVDNTCEYVGIELGIFDMAKMLCQRFAGQCLGFPMVSFIPTYPPTFDIFSLVYPWFSHSLIISTILMAEVTSEGNHSNV